MKINTEGLHEIANTRNSARIADIVFVHGLNGGSHSTWRYGKVGDNDHFFWPEELGKDLPQCGIWSLGYAAGLTHWFGDPSMAIQERARNLVLKLLNGQIGQRPLIFITHSMGGLEVKEIIVRSQTRDSEEWQQLVSSVRGVVFCGTPHRGAHLATAAKVLANFLRTQDHLQQMKMGAPELDTLHDEFLIWQRKSGISIESYVEKIGLFRTRWWSRPLPLGLAVPLESGNPGVASCDCHPISADHITLVKPNGRHHDVYAGVLRFISKAVYAANFTFPAEFKMEIPKITSTFDQRLFVDRDRQEFFQKFLKQNERMVFPVLGPGGSGKTWQLQALVNSCFENDFLPVVVSARLLSNLHDGVKNNIHSALPFLRDERQNNLESIFRGIQKFNANSENRIIVIIDGLNEYHFGDLEYQSIKSDLVELFTLCNTFNIHLFFSCRIFTWNEFLRDEAFKPKFFVSEIIEQIKFVTEYDRDKGQSVERKIISQIPSYGISIGDFDTKELNCFWERLEGAGDICESRSRYKSIANPFLLGLLGQFILDNKGVPPPPQHLFSEYINRQLGKGSESEQRSAHNFLLEFAGMLISSSSDEVAPYLGSSRIMPLQRHPAYIPIMDSGIICSAQTDIGKQRFYFKHDILLHYFVSEALKDRLGLDTMTNTEVLVEMFLLAQRCDHKSSNDYFRESVRFIINSFVGDLNYCNASDQLLQRTFLLLEKALRTESNGLPVTRLVEILKSEPWGNSVASIAKKKATPNEVCELLKLAAEDDADSTLVANLLLLAARAPEEEAVNFFKTISDNATSRTVKLRCAFGLGELTNTPQVIKELLKLLDFTSSHFTNVNNACVYSFGSIGHQLSTEQYAILENQIGSSWRMQIYRKSLGI